MATYQPPKKNTAFIFYVSLVSQANTKVFQGTPTIAAGDFKVSIDGGALNNLATLPAVTPAASKMVKIELSAAEMNGDNIMVVASDAAGAEWCDAAWLLQTSARQVDDLAFPATSGRSLAVDASGNVVLQGVTHTGAVIPTVTNLTNAPTAGDLTATMKASVNTEVDNALDTAIPGVNTPNSVNDILLDQIRPDVAAILVDTGTTLDGRIPAALVGGKMNSDATAISGAAVIADRLEAWLNGFITGSATGVPTASVIDTDLTEATDDHYNHMIMAFTGGALLGQARRISDYNGTTKEITVQPAFTEAPAAGDTFIIVTIIVGGLDANGRMDLGSVLGSAINALIAGRIDANAQVVGTGAIVAGSFGAGAIDAAAIAPDAIGASEIAADAIGSSELAASAVAEIADGVLDEPRAGHTTLGTLGESFAVIITGSAIAGTLSTTQMTTDLTEATDDHYNGRTLIWTSGVLLGQATKITDYTGATKLLTYTAVTEAPSAGDDFIIV